MPMIGLNESVIEQAALAILSSLGYEVAFGPNLAPDGQACERERYSDVVLIGRLRAALARLNPALPVEALDEAARRVVSLDAPTLIAANRKFHDYLVNGVGVEVLRDGYTGGETVALVDFIHPERNDWLAVNQFTVVENGHNRRPDIVLFVNGLPLVVLELKNVADEKVELEDAYKYFLTYKMEIPSLFHYNEALVISDGLQAKVGTLTADVARFQPWRTIDGAVLADNLTPQQDVLLLGLFDPRRFLGYLRDFIVFDTSDTVPAKKMAAYHQYHAVRKAVDSTIAATAPHGDRRIGVVWHTQGSGKSLTMAFFAGSIIRHPAMQNPTIVVITDRIGNPGPGGGGVVITTPDGKTLTEHTGDSTNATNNQMEICAAIMALKVCPEGNIVILTDSKYVVDGITKWIKGWKDNGWRNSQKKPVENQKPWKLLDAAVESRTGIVKWRWIDRNTEDLGHQRAHTLAEKAARRAMRKSSNRNSDQPA